MAESSTRERNFPCSLRYSTIFCAVRSVIPATYQSSECEAVFFAFPPEYTVLILYRKNDPEITMWEGIEFYMEAGYTHVHAITYWLQGIEFWGNRLITDPLITVAGGMIGLHRRSLILPARILSLAFLFTHVFVFPHCMYLQDLIDRVGR